MLNEASVRHESRFKWNKQTGVCGDVGGGVSGSSVITLMEKLAV